MNNNKIMISYGDKADRMVKELLEEAKIEKEINKDDLIALKPNLIKAAKSETGATTDPDLTKGIIEYLRDKGFSNIIIIEGSWVGANTENAFEVCGYKDISKEYDIPLYNLQKDNYKTKTSKGMEIEISEKALEVNYLINLPVLKGHCQTTITCALKNLKGCISNKEKRRFHRQGLHKPIASLNKVLKPNLIIVDGIYGDLDFEEGGNPVKMNRLILGKDPVLIDSYAANLLGYSGEEIEYIKLAQDFGVGSLDIQEAEIIEINKDKASKIENKSIKIKKLAEKVKAKEACSACYGSLIHALKRVNERGELDKIKETIKIGQGYKNKEVNGPGVGNCCSGADNYVKGCPPSAKDILDFLRGEFIE
ncbi:MAG: DUF362 domain-containing protein [Bacillota bacterium]